MAGDREGEWCAGACERYRLRPVGCEYDQGSFVAAFLAWLWDCDDRDPRNHDASRTPVEPNVWQRLQLR